MITAKVIKDKDGLNVGEEYEVRSIDMGQSYTSIYLETPKEGTKNPFNSVIFDFYEYGEEVNIFSDRRFNPYLEVDADDDDTPGGEEFAVNGMDRPKIEDFKPEYTKGVAEIASVAKQYAKAQEECIDYLEGLVKNCSIPDVSNRRELYFAFMKEYNALMGESEHQILKEEVEVLLAKYSC